MQAHHDEHLLVRRHSLRRLGERRPHIAPRNGRPSMCVDSWNGHGKRHLCASCPSPSIRAIALLHPEAPSVYNPGDAGGRALGGWRSRQPRWGNGRRRRRTFRRS